MMKNIQTPELRLQSLCRCLLMMTLTLVYGCDSERRAVAPSSHSETDSLGDSSEPSEGGVPTLIHDRLRSPLLDRIRVRYAAEFKAVSRQSSSNAINRRIANMAAELQLADRGVDSAWSNVFELAVKDRYEASDEIALILELFNAICKLAENGSTPAQACVLERLLSSPGDMFPRGPGSASWSRRVEQEKAIAAAEEELKKKPEYDPEKPWTGKVEFLAQRSICEKVNKRFETICAERKRQGYKYLVGLAEHGDLTAKRILAMYLYSDQNRGGPDVDRHYINIDRNRAINLWVSMIQDGDDRAIENAVWLVDQNDPQAERIFSEAFIKARENNREAINSLARKCEYCSSLVLKQFVKFLENKSANGDPDCSLWLGEIYGSNGQTPHHSGKPREEVSAIFFSTAAIQGNSDGWYQLSKYHGKRQTNGSIQSPQKWEYCLKRAAVLGNTFASAEIQRISQQDSELRRMLLSQLEAENRAYRREEANGGMRAPAFAHRPATLYDGSIAAPLRDVDVLLGW